MISSPSESWIKKIKVTHEYQPGKKLALAENHVSKSPQLGTGLSDKRYKPCYGWISNDDEEEEELIELPLAPWLSGVN